MAVAVAFVVGVLAVALFGASLTGRLAVADPLETAAIPSAQALRAGQPADVLRVMDGDTFEARVHVWPGIEITTKVRLRDIDAPELRARCPEERTKAEAAREGLRIMLAEGDVMVVQVSLDKYGGRVVAGASTRTTPDVGAALIARGLVRSYNGRRREPWCTGT